MAKDGRQIAAEVAPELDYLSRVSRKLGVVDLVHDYFDPLVGDWNDLREEAVRWRKAAEVTDAVTKHVSAPLGGVDARWQGADADAFLDHMRQVGLAGGDMSDAMNAMADALEETAEGVRDIVQDMAHVLADVADSVSGTASLPLEGDQRAVRHIEDVKEPVRELHESARQVMEAFLRLCDGLSGEARGFDAVRMEHRYPEKDWTYTAPAKQAVTLPEAATASATASAGAAVPAGGGGAAGGVGGAGSGAGSSAGSGVGSAGVPAAATPASPMQFGGATGVAEQAPAPAGGAGTATAAAAVGGRPGGASGGMGMGMGGMGMMGGMMGGQQGGGDKEHKPKQRLSGTIEDLLGKPKKAAPKTIGDED